MATIRSELKTRAPADEVWSAVRDIGALHTRLVPGFVVDTRLEPGARIVTFINGVTLREPIVTLDDEARRLVWAAEGGRARHYNAALQVSALPRISCPTTSTLISRGRSRREWRRCRRPSTAWRPREGRRGEAPDESRSLRDVFQ
jgi:hypothetical protein